jgi:hypothetical protein
MVINSRKLLSNQALTLEKRVAVERLRRAGIELSGDLGLGRLKSKKKSSHSNRSDKLVKHLAGG